MDSSAFNPNITIGAYQIGVLISYVLFGVMTTQTYIYYSRFPDDSPKLKAFVAFFWVCEVTHALCIGHTLYTYTISDYGHPERLDNPETFLVTAAFFAGIIGACAQGFFAFRIYRLSEKLLIPILCWFMAFLRMLGAIVLLATAGRKIPVKIYEMHWTWLITALWSVSTANDLVITMALVTILVRQRTYAQRRTVALVDKLIVWTIETGMLTSSAAIAMLACFVAMKTNFIWLGIFAILSRLYSNSLLASLNSRTTLRALNEVSQPYSIPVGLQSWLSSSIVNEAQIGLASSEIQMTKVTQITYDTEPTGDQSNKSTSEEV
ncbi:hypothetical protein B0H13DRAFT_2535094 [Mycena leptocephala]|nr:hypothetical protein B0H13DRAFT_2535094 [Mycena leptocephala]